MTEEYELLDDLLVEINKVRSAFQMPEIAALEQGVPGDGSSCPIARSLANGWSCEADTMVIVMEFNFPYGDEKFNAIVERMVAAGFIEPTYQPESSSITFLTTPVMREFIKRFDRKDFIYLVEDDGEES